jgi:hypothetical protein
VLALRGGAGLVASWAQLSSLIDVVAGASLAGVGAGVTVYVAQAATREQQLAVLRGGLLIGLAVSAAAFQSCPHGGRRPGRPGGGDSRHDQLTGSGAAAARCSRLPSLPCSIALAAGILAPRDAVLEALAAPPRGTGWPAFSP